MLNGKPASQLVNKDKDIDRLPESVCSKPPATMISSHSHDLRLGDNTPDALLWGETLP